MAEETLNTAAEQPIVINAQYTKDLSFEALGAPLIFSKMQEEAPTMSVNVNVGANPIQGNTFETILEIQAECKIKDEVAFILELEYAGVFSLTAGDYVEVFGYQNRGGALNTIVAAGYPCELWVERVA